MALLKYLVYLRHCENAFGPNFCFLNKSKSEIEFFDEDIVSLPIPSSLVLLILVVKLLVIIYYGFMSMYLYSYTHMVQISDIKKCY